MTEQENYYQILKSHGFIINSYEEADDIVWQIIRYGLPTQLPDKEAINLPKETINAINELVRNVLNEYGEDSLESVFQENDEWCKKHKKGKLYL